MAKIQVISFFDKQSNTYSYVVADTDAGCCAVIDAVMDFDFASGVASYSSANQIIAFVRQQGWQLDWVLETHVHADHLSAGRYIQKQLGGRLGIGDQITQVQTVFSDVFNVEPNFVCDGQQFDKLFADNEVFFVGGLQVKVLQTPGHTPACVTYLFDKTCAFVGDTLFMPDFGTARCDFPGGDARQLFKSIQRLLCLSGDTQLYMCHDYPTANRLQLMNMTTVDEQRRLNIHVHEGVLEDDFVRTRSHRDSQLPMPRLLMPSVQVNMRGGSFPPAEANGKIFLKVPFNIRD
jgi:glyoxylase-like metal-dependent hydrolase (beta-lactamase superfamily II)